jgi:hypothetical protein
MTGRTRSASLAAVSGTPAQVVIADKGPWGRAYRDRLAADGVTLLTPDRTRTAAILALTIGILLNTLNGRPARALAAYDGR